MAGLSSGGLSSDQAVSDDPAIALLKLMADPTALSSRVSEYQAAKEAADAAITKVGEANKIPELLSQAKMDRDIASGILAKAEVDSVATIAKANNDADAIMKAAQARAKDSQALADAADAERADAVAAISQANKDAASILAAAKSEAAAIQSQAAVILADANAAKAESNSLMEYALAAKAKFEARLKKLQAASADD